MFKNIVVPIDVDHPDQGKDALEKAKTLAGQDGSVTVVNVVEDVPGFITAELPDELINKAAHDARDSLDGMAKTAGLKAEVQIRSGRPHRAIVGLADEVGADLIVVGSHSPSMSDYLLGSTASSVVRHAKCSVLVTR